MARRSRNRTRSVRVAGVALIAFGFGTAAIVSSSPGSGTATPNSAVSTSTPVVSDAPHSPAQDGYATERRTHTGSGDLDLITIREVGLQGVLGVVRDGYGHVAALDEKWPGGVLGAGEWPARLRHPPSRPLFLPRLP